MAEVEQFGDFTSIEKHERYAIVRFDRGDGLNALSVKAMKELRDVARSFEDDLQRNAIILTGTDKVFSAGADLSDPLLVNRPSNLLERRHTVKIGPDMCEAWEKLEQVTICALEGFSIGGGVAIAIACDIRIAGEDAYFRLPEVPIGMNLGWHSVPRAVNLVGPARTKLFVILGEKLSAEKALDWGLIEEIAPAGSALAAAMDMAERLGEMPPLALRMSKQSIDVAAKALNHATTFMDRDQFTLTSTTKDQKEAIAAYFEKREPKFTGE